MPIRPKSEPRRLRKSSAPKVGQPPLASLREAEAVRASEARYRALFELGPVAVYSCDTDGVIQEFNRRAAELWGREPELGDTDERFCGSFRLYRPDGSFMPHRQCPMALVVAGKLSSVRDGELLIERPDGSRVTVLVNISPLTDAHGEIVGAINCFYDITDRKKAEERERLLASELAHRGKNLLSVVHAIVSRSLTGTRSLEEARDVILKRLQALSRGHAVLDRDGEAVGAPVAEIIRLEFESFSERVTAVGPEVVLAPRAAQTFALVVHELATNASKYGALSAAGSGRVVIDWSIIGTDGDGRFQFRWRERGGPTVAEPERSGFGRMLMERAAADEFGAQPKLSFAPEGLTYEFVAPLSPLAASMVADAGARGWVGAAARVIQT